MLRDNLVGLIEPMLSSAGAYTLALGTARKQSSDDRPPCLENPRPEGAESTLTENAASPFHAEPKQMLQRIRVQSLDAPIFPAPARHLRRADLADLIVVFPNSEHRIDVTVHRWNPRV